MIGEVSTLFVNLTLVITLPIATRTSAGSSRRSVTSLSVSIVSIRVRSHNIVATRSLCSFLRSSTRGAISVSTRAKGVATIDRNVAGPEVAIGGVYGNRSSYLVRGHIPCTSFKFDKAKAGAKG